jgi:hypothetical protein
MIPFLGFYFTLLHLMAAVSGRANIDAHVHPTPATTPNNQLLVLMLDGYDKLKHFKLSFYLCNLYR